jgi:hypothetical protein
MFAAVLPVFVAEEHTGAQTVEHRYGCVPQPAARPLPADGANRALRYPGAHDWSRHVKNDETWGRPYTVRLARPTPRAMRRVTGCGPG